MTMSGKVYDALKWIVQIVLPACGALYSALAALYYSRENSSAPGKGLRT